MTSSSPSEFLTFYRRAVNAQALRYRPVSQISRRQFTAVTACQADTGNPHGISTKGTQQDTGAGQGVGASREHALDKGNKNDPNVQSNASKEGRRYVDQYTPTLNLRTGREAFERVDESDWTYADAWRSLRSQDSGGQATRQKDERNSTARAKQEHPEAPDVVIGMQDERGGKGV